MFLFNRSFVGKEDLTLKPRLVTEELSGIANWSIEGLKRLRENGKFTIGAHGKAAQAQLTKSQSPALRYASECLTVTGDKADMLPVTMAFAAYEDWANRESLKPNGATRATLPTTSLRRCGRARSNTRRSKPVGTIRISRRAGTASGSRRAFWGLS
jgi:phage/plasmid-associated DNA primase